MRQFRPAYLMIGILLSVPAMAGASAVPAAGSVAAPALHLSVPSSAPTQLVKLSGSGFGPTAKVQVTFSQKWVATAQPGTGGSFQLSFHVPKTAVPGKHEIRAAQAATGDAAQIALLVHTNWRNLGFNSAHCDCNPYENVLGPATVSQLGQQWVSAAVTNSGDAPLVDGNLVLTGGYNGATAVNAATGATVWQLGGEAEVGGATGIAVASGLVYVGTGAGQLIAVDEATGAMVWQYRFPVASFPGDPTAAGGMVYLDGPDGVFYAFDGTTGTVAWTSPYGNPATGPPPVANGVLYFAGTGPQGSDLVAVDAATGTVIYSAPMGAFGLNGAAVSGGVVYSYTRDQANHCSISAYSAATGSLLWSTSLNTTAGFVDEGSPAVGDGMVFGATTYTMLYALNASDGSLAWQQPITDSGGAPVIANSVLYKAANSDFTAYDPATGQTLATYKPPGFASTTPSVVNGVLYFQDSYIFAYALPPSSKHH